MPYKTNDELPGEIKNNLPAQAQDIWRNAFNSAFEKDKDEESSVKIAWGAVKNAGWTKDDNGAWKKLNYELRDIEIFSVGTHRGKKYTENDLDDIVSSFNELRDKIKPPLKIAHMNNMHKKDGQPSLGWATELKRIGGKLLASFSNVPKLVKDALSKKLYKRVSSELYNNLVIGDKKYKRVLAGVGLLGADIPEVKNLQDIEIFFNDNNEIITHEFDVNNGVIQYTEKNTMDVKEIEALFQKKIDAMQADIDKIKADSQAQLDAQAQKFSEEKEELENKLIEKDRNVSITEFKTFCEKAIADCKIFPAARDILYNDTEKITFSEDNEIVIPFTKFKAFIEKTHEIIDKSERGFHIPAEKREKKTDKTTYVEKKGVKLFDTDLDDAVKKYMRENKIDYIEAMTNVLSDNPELAEKFSETGQKIAEDE